MPWKGQGSPSRGCGIKGVGSLLLPGPLQPLRLGSAAVPALPPCWRELCFPLGCLGGWFRLQNPFSCCTSASALPERDVITLSCRSERLQEYFCTKRCLVPRCPWRQGTDGHHAYLCPALITSQPSFCSHALTAKLLILESRVKLQGRERPQEQPGCFLSLSKIVTYFWTSHWEDCNFTS